MAGTRDLLDKKQYLPKVNPLGGVRGEVTNGC